MITTLEEVKSLLNIIDSSKDAHIMALLPVVESYISQKTGVIYSETEIAPEALKNVAAQIIKFYIEKATTANGIQSESLGDYSVTYASGATGEDLPNHITALLNPFRRVKFI